MKEILIHLKPNNFPRYLDQLSELETGINAIDATKYNHASSVKVTVAETEPDVMKEEVAITKEDIEKSDAKRRVNDVDGEEESGGDGEKESGGVEKKNDGDGEKESEETQTESENTEEKEDTTQNANNPQEGDHPTME